MLPYVVWQQQEYFYTKRGFLATEEWEKIFYFKKHRPVEMHAGAFF